MTGLAIPKHLKMNSTNRPLCARIGIRFNGQDRNDVVEYDIERGYIWTKSGECFHGAVEPYWRGSPRRGSATAVADKPKVTDAAANPAKQDAQQNQHGE